MKLAFSIKISPVVKMYLAIVVFLVLDAVLIFFFIAPAVQDINAISKQSLTDKTKIASLDEQNQAIDSFKKKQNDYQDNLQAIRHLFVDVDNPVDFIKFLEATAADSRVTADITLNTSSQASPDDQTVAFQVFVQGDFSDVLQFARKVENGPYLVSMKNVSAKKLEPRASAKDKASLPPEVEATFTVEAAVL